MKAIVTSRGDGNQITLSEDELRKDIIEGRLWGRPLNYNLLFTIKLYFH